MYACSRVYPTVACGQFSIHNSYSGRNRKPEERIRNSCIKPPVLEFELEVDTTATPHEYPDEFTRILLDFENYQVTFRMSGVILRRLGGLGLRAFEQTG